MLGGCFTVWEFENELALILHIRHNKIEKIHEQRRNKSEDKRT